MSAVAKADLARAGTMQVTAKEGQQYLDKNVTEWKKQELLKHFNDGEEAETSKPAQLSKSTTMKATAKEGEKLLEGVKPDDDALTRGQQKKIEEITEKPAAKKPKMAKGTTMVNTAEEAKTLLAGESLGDTRQQTKVTQKPKSKGTVKKLDSIAKTMEEAKAVYGDLDMSEGRSLRKRPAPPAKPPMKKAGTMQKTAKEGKAFLKKAKKAEEAAKEAEKEEAIEEEKDAEDEAEEKA